MATAAASLPAGVNAASVNRLTALIKALTRRALRLGQHRFVLFGRAVEGQLLPGGLQQQQLAQVADHLAAELAGIGAGSQCFMNDSQPCRPVAVEPGIYQLR